MWFSYINMQHTRIHVNAVKDHQLIDNYVKWKEKSNETRLQLLGLCKSWGCHDSGDAGCALLCYDIV